MYIERRLCVSVHAPGLQRDVGRLKFTRTDDLAAHAHDDSRTHFDFNNAVQDIDIDIDIDDDAGAARDHVSIRRSLDLRSDGPMGW